MTLPEEFTIDAFLTHSVAAGKKPRNMFSFDFVLLAANRAVGQVLSTFSHSQMCLESSETHFGSNIEEEIG